MLDEVEVVEAEVLDEDPETTDGGQSMAVEPAEAMEHPSRELTAEEIEAKREEVDKLEQTIKNCLAAGRAAMWALYGALYKFNEERGWEVLGYDSQGEWLAQAEIGMSKRTFFRGVRMFRETVIERSLTMETVEQLDPSKVDIVLPAIERNVISVEEAMEDVKTLGAQDLRERYIGAARKTKEHGEGEGDATSSDSTGAVVDSTAKDTKKKGKEEKAPEPKWLQSAQVVDSWLEMGGDRRKATRHWDKFVETHPVFHSVELISAFMHGSDDFEGKPVNKDVAKAAWTALSEALSLSLTQE